MRLLQKQQEGGFGSRGWLFFLAGTSFLITVCVAAAVRLDFIPFSMSISVSSENGNKASKANQANTVKPRVMLPPFEFPDGGRTIFPKYRLVALYGTPGEPVLGALGQQSPGDSINRVKKLAADYQKYSKQVIYPAFEMIATVASASPTDNGDYSREVPASKLLPWVKTAKQNGVYVVLDLQSGRNDSLTQAKEYESLLKYPNVGLALDPEWRLKSNELPMRQIGAIDIEEVNEVAAWLANLTNENKLPQKLFVLHQFRLDMLPRRDKLDTSYNQLAYVIQMDGQGQQSEKRATWRAITQDPLKNLNYGWKNFYKKDPEMLTPKQTMAIMPAPNYISYQ
jgi:hypothetical protein